MKKLTSLQDAYPICAAIGAPLRLEILQILLASGAQNIDTLAKKLHVTAGALTRHIKILQDAELIAIDTIAGNRGNQKVCSIQESKFLIELSGEGVDGYAKAVDVGVGLFSDYLADGHCGVLSQEGFIGARDNAKSFLMQNRSEASCLWLQKGYLSYLLPIFKTSPVPQTQSRQLSISGSVSPSWMTEFKQKSMLEKVFNQKPNRNQNVKPKSSSDELRISLEISPDIVGGGVNPKASEVSFLLDDLLLATIKIQSPKEKRRGYLTPEWHDDILPQYGTLILIRITPKGTYFDGQKTSDVTTQDAIKTKKFSIVTDTGFTLFGNDFGDYGQGIRVF